MKKRVLSRILCLFLCLTAVPTAFAASEESTVTVSLTQLAPGYYLGAVWDGDELLTMFDYTVGADGKLETTVGVGKVFSQGKELTVGISSANTDGAAIPPITYKIGENVPSVPSQPTTPSTPDSSGSSTSYRIYAPSSVTGGSILVSRTYAVPGTRVYIDVYEKSNYVLGELYLVDRQGNSVRLTRQNSVQYSFIMPDSSVDIYVDFERIYYSSSSSSSSSAVITSSNAEVPQQKTGMAQWRYSNGLIYDSAGAVKADTFLTRDMLLSILFHADGQSTENPIFWAMSAGIVGDYWGAGLSGGDKVIARDQMAYILYNYARSKGYAYSVSAGSYSESAHPCTREAFAWASAVGLFDNTVSPRDNMAAGQASAVLKQFFDKITH